MCTYLVTRRHSRRRFRASIWNDEVNGLSPSKLGRLGQEAQIFKVYTDATVKCRFEDRDQHNVPIEALTIPGLKAPVGGIELLQVIGQWQDFRVRVGRDNVRGRAFFYVVSADTDAEAWQDDEEIALQLVRFHEALQIVRDELGTQALGEQLCQLLLARHMRMICLVSVSAPCAGSWQGGPPTPNDETFPSMRSRFHVAVLSSCTPSRTKPTGALWGTIWLPPPRP